MIQDRNMHTEIQVDLDVISINDILIGFCDLRVVLLEDIVVNIVGLNYGMMSMIIHILSHIFIHFHVSIRLIEM
jgi:hypothetical protein